MTKNVRFYFYSLISLWLSVLGERPMIEGRKELEFYIIGNPIEIFSFFPFFSSFLIKGENKENQGAKN